MAKILIIDDDANLCVALGAFLERHHHTVSFKTNGTDGLQAVREAAPEVIICDLDMPGLNGQQVLTSLRQDDQASEIPVIYLSGCADRNIIRHSINLGSDDYLAKPAAPGEVLAAVEARLRRRRQLQQREHRRLRQAVEVFSGIVHDLERNEPPTRWLAGDPTSAGPSASVSALPAGNGAPAGGLTPNSPLMVKTETGKRFIKLSEVKAFLAYGEYSRIHWGKNGQHMLFRKALKQWEGELPAGQFVRIHRGSIINLAFLDSLDATDGGNWQVRLREFAPLLPVSHRARAGLNRRLRAFSPGGNFSS